MTTIELEEITELRPQFVKRNGILPVAVQENSNGQILILASVNEEAFNNTIKHKICTFYSTSRNKLWIKGQT